MGRNLDLDHCTNKQRRSSRLMRGIGGKRKEDCRRRSLGDEPGPIEDKVLVSDFDAILSEPPAHSNLKWERENMKRRKDLADFFFFDWD